MVAADTAQFSASDVGVSFGSTVALDSVDLTIAKGEHVALIGPSGSGKSTLLRLLATALEPTGGELTTLDHSPSRLGPRELQALRARIAFMPQDLGLVPNLRVISNVLNGAIGQRSLLSQLRSLTWPRAAEKERAFSLLERVGISEKIYDFTQTLSGGQQQRVAIARALFQQPHALLADEPVSALDPRTSAAAIDLLTSVANEHGITLVVSLHDLALARSRFPRVIGLRDGRVEFDGAPDDISEARFTALFAHPEP